MHRHEPRCNADRAEMIAEGEQLQIQIQALHAAHLDDVRDLKAENVRLDMEWRQAHGRNEELVSERFKLKAENARLRGALEAVFMTRREDGLCWCAYEQEHISGPSPECRLARAALSGDKP